MTAAVAMLTSKAMEGSLRGEGHTQGEAQGNQLKERRLHVTFRTDHTDDVCHNASTQQCRVMSYYRLLTKKVSLRVMWDDMLLAM